jgi:hypothetical protein
MALSKNDALVLELVRGGGYWRLNLETLELVHRSYHQAYNVDLESCTTSEAILDWTMQVAAKAWISDAAIGTLVRAINVLLKPQQTVCSGSMNGDNGKSITREEVAGLVKARVRSAQSSTAEEDAWWERWVAECA